MSSARASQKTGRVRTAVVNGGFSSSAFLYRVIASCCRPSSFTVLAELTAVPTLPLMSTVAGPSELRRTVIEVNECPLRISICGKLVCVVRLVEAAVLPTCLHIIAFSADAAMQYPRHSIRDTSARSNHARASSTDSAAT